MPDATPCHVPVLRDRVVELLLSSRGVDQPVLLDATLGLGGHSEALLRHHPSCRVLGLDRDPAALDAARARLCPFADRFAAYQAVYDELPDVLAQAGIERLDGVLFDLGVSSMQLDRQERGFAYRFDAPLDMRMDPGSGPTAADVLNTYAAPELERVLRDYGEERFARKIARAVVAQREHTPFVTSGPLVELLHREIPAASQRTGGHPAKRTFQALRIEVNQELSVWRRALPAALDALALGGRIVVLSYHSLEDRIAKGVLQAAATDTSPPGLPVPLPDHAPTMRLLVRGVETPTDAEIADNPRAASAKLRAAECVRLAEREAR